MNELQHTALCVAVNAVQLLEWLQRREKFPLPIVAKSTEAVTSSSPETSSSSFSAATAASPPSAPLTSVPIDPATNSIISLLGHILLFRVWDGTKVFQSVREALFTSSALDVPAFLLSLLSASSAFDGGSIMFSELYSRPAGHTRHTRESQVKEDYVNQFSGEERKEDGKKGEDAAAAASSSSNAISNRTSAFARPSDVPRNTPYQFKSNLLRLIASLAFQHRGFQSSFGAPAIYACMNHSVLDTHNPLMREYAILALRNLLEENEENQKVVAELRAQGVANQEELAEMGVESEDGRSYWKSCGLHDGEAAAREGCEDAEGGGVLELRDVREDTGH